MTIEGIFVVAGFVQLSLLRLLNVGLIGLVGVVILYL